MSSNIGGSSGVRFSGLGSGIDTAAIVDALMRVERLPIDRLEAEKRKVNSRNSVVSEMDGQIKALRDAARNMFSSTALQGKTATTANKDVATASAAGTAANGTYNVVVTALASAHTLAGGTNPPLVAGENLDITVGGTTKTVAVQSGDTLQAFADRINGTANIGASASVINNRLVLISKEGGSAGTITLGGTAAAGLGMVQTQPGADAAATVNGVPITGTTNRIEGAINGVTLDLASLGSTTITVATDNTAVVGQVQKFVDAYNKLVTNMNNATRYDAASKTAGTLQGDSMFTSFMSSLRGTTGAGVTGITGNYDSLAAIGITSSRTGELTLDQGKFTEALTADPDAVRAVFGVDDGTTTTSSADGVARRIAAIADDFSTNAISSRQAGTASTIQRINDRIAKLEDLMVTREQRLRAQFQAMETAVSRLRSQGSDLSARLGG